MVMVMWFVLSVEEEQRRGRGDRTRVKPRAARSPPTRLSKPAPGASARTESGWQRQVFGLVGGAGAEASTVTYWPSLPRWQPSADDGVRSHIPLRGSSGFAPDSLLRRPTWLVGRTTTSTTIYRNSGWRDPLHMVFRGRYEAASLPAGPRREDAWATGSWRS